MLAGAHVPDAAGPLPVAREAGRRELVKRHPLGPACEQRLGDPSSAEDALERPDVDILARVRARHHGKLGRAQVEGGDATGLDQGGHAERLRRRSQEHDAVRVAEHPEQPAARVGFDDVAAMLTLDDVATDLANEHRRNGRRRRPATRARRGRAAGRTGRARRPDRNRGRISGFGRDGRWDV